MKHKRLFVIFAVATILMTQFATTAALWVNDGSAETSAHTFQCRGDGDIEIRFFNNDGTMMNFYELNGDYFIDYTSQKEEFQKEGLIDAGDFITVSLEPKKISYLPEMFGYFELTVKPSAGFIFSKFLDSSCSCPETLDFIDGAYHVTPDSIKTILAVFSEDVNYVKPTSGITMILDGKVIPVDIPPFIEKGRTMVPVRFIGETLGAVAAWDSNTGIVTMTATDGTTITLKNGDTDLIVEKDGETSVIPMDITAIIRDGRIFVPARFIAEAFGVAVVWNGQAKTVTFNSTKAANDSQRFKEEYEALNEEKDEDGTNKYTSLTIDKDNNVIYLTYEELVSFLENKTGVLYFGRPGCPWCRLLTPYMLDFAEKANISIYYYNIEKDRDENNEKYKNIVSILGNHLPTVDTVTQKEGAPDFNPELKRVVLPQLFFIKDGEVKADMFMFQHEYLKNHESEKTMQLLWDKYAAIDCDC